MERPFYILPIARVSRDNVEMKMKYVLLGLRPRTANDLDVPNPKFFMIHIHDDFQRCHEVEQLIFRHGEDVSVMLFWDHKCVELIHGMNQGKRITSLR